MRILHLIHKIQNRGAETFASQLANHQKKLGHEVIVVSLFEGTSILPFNGEIKKLGGKPSARFFDFKAWKKLNSIVKEFRPDIIQANAGDTLKYAVFSKRLFRWKAPIVFRNASEVGRYLSGRLQKVYNKFLYQNIDYVISVSKASKIDLISHYPFLKDKIKVIPVGLERIKIQDKNNLLGDSQNIVHVGGFTFEKNHRGLIKIFQLIQKSNSKAKLHLIGDGILRKEVEAQVSNANLSDKIIFHGFVNNPLDYISNANLLVLPSIIEGLPGVILEAMYCKTPVIAYNVGGVSEILNAATGDLIERGDEMSFAKTSLKNLETPDSNKIQRAYEIVTEDFMNDKLALNFLHTYQNKILG